MQIISVGLWLVRRKNFITSYSNLCISHFVYWRNHRLCCSWRFWWHRPYFIVKFLLSLCILFIHCSFVCQVSIDLIYFSPLKFFWVLASSLVIVLKLFLFFGNLSLSVLIRNVYRNNTQLITRLFLMIHSVSLPVQQSRFLPRHAF